MTGPGFIFTVTAHLRPVVVDRTPGHAIHVRYSMTMTPGYVLAKAMPYLSDEEALTLVKLLGLAAKPGLEEKR